MLDAGEADAQWFQMKDQLLILIIARYAKSRSVSGS